MSLQGIYLASRSVSTQQRALEVTGQNISNVNTPGYTRQTAVLSPVASTSGAQLVGSSGVGGGVDISLVLRNRATWLDRSADSLRAQVGDSGVATQLATRIEGVLGEPGDTGVQATLNRFFSSFQAAANQPDDATLRASAVRAGGQVLTRFEGLLSDLQTLHQETLTGAQAGVDQLNDLTKQIASFNHMIGGIQAAGQPANELLDQREALLEQLTSLTGALISGREGGELVVSVGGITLVQGAESQALQLHEDGTLATAGGTAVPLAGGALGARLQVVQSVLPDYQSRFSAVRDALVREVNALHTSGRDRSGAQGTSFFVAQASGEWGVNPSLQADPSRLALGDGTAGDGSVARAIAQLREHPQLLAAYQSLVAETGARVVSARNRSEMATASLSQVQNMQAAEGGVNLDEELANMVAQQHVYSASARLLSTYDQMLETLIQRTGV